MDKYERREIKEHAKHDDHCDGQNHGFNATLAAEQGSCCKKIHIVSSIVIFSHMHLLYPTLPRKSS